MAWRPCLARILDGLRAAPAAAARAVSTSPAAAAAAAAGAGAGATPRAARAAAAAAELPEALQPVVALVGRPNVGKSALLNRLARRRAALVADTPGGHVTRDFIEAPARLGDLRFVAVDTSGLEPAAAGGSIQARAAALTGALLARRADAALLLLDGRAGVGPADAALAGWLRAAAPRLPLVLVANKCEAGGGGAAAAALADAPRLGFGEAVAVSAATGEGMADLHAALAPVLDPLVAARRAAVAELTAGEDEGAGGGGGDSNSNARPVRVAVMGLPNVGKSSLTNALLGAERCLTGPEPGLTRDAVKARLPPPPAPPRGWGARGPPPPVELVDTAGWVRRARLAAHDADAGGALAAAAGRAAAAVMGLVHVVVLVVDGAAAAAARAGLTHREASLAAAAAAEGRALLLAVNKLDALPSAAAAERTLARVRASAAAALPDAAGARVLGLSAATGAGVAALVPAVLDAHAAWCRRVPTAALNRWAAALAAARGAARGGGADAARLKYVVQVKARPPTFAAFVRGGDPLPEATRRSVANALRRDFGFDGVPVRVLVRPAERRGAGGRRRGRRAPG